MQLDMFAIHYLFVWPYFLYLKQNKHVGRNKIIHFIIVFSKSSQNNLCTMKMHFCRRFRAFALPVIRLDKLSILKENVGALS